MSLSRNGNSESLIRQVGFISSTEGLSSISTTSLGVNFINILQTAFTHADPESVKKIVKMSFFLLSFSFSSTFYEQLFCAKVFYVIIVWFLIFVKRKSSQKPVVKCWYNCHQKPSIKSDKTLQSKENSHCDEVC